MKRAKIGFEIVPDSEESAQLVMRWRNDPETLKWSFDGEPKRWPAFLLEFRQKYLADPLQPCFFAQLNQERIALVRFRTMPSRSSTGAKAADISINLAPDHRGKGLGKEILKSVCQHLSGHLRAIGYSKIVAEIMPENLVSIKAFEAAGFRFHDEGTHKIDQDRSVKVLSYIFELNATCTSEFQIGDGHPCFIIAEAGSNWRLGSYPRDLKMAFALIDAAKEAGCDAVKFQTYRAETTYVQGAGESDYLANNGIKQDISEIFKDLSMPYEMLEELANYCKKEDIVFMSSPFSVKDLLEVDKFTPLHKIASYEITHARLIDAAAKTGKPLILSTGASELNDIETALNRFRENSQSPVFLMQCTAKYPADNIDLNLSAITQMKARFAVPVGLSDHSRDPIIAPVCAVALGANLLEKHFTLSNDLPGPDHKFAITKSELKAMVKAVRQAEETRGIGHKTVLEAEKELFHFARRSLQATKNIAAGEALREGENFDILRPGKQRSGMNPMSIDSLQKVRSRRLIPAGDGIQFEDLDHD